MFRTGSMRVYMPLSLILAIVIAFPMFARWEAFLLFVFGPKASIADPVYGKDISYYLFSFPIYALLQSRIFISFAILLLGVLFSIGWSTVYSRHRSRVSKRERKSTYASWSYPSSR